MGLFSALYGLGLAGHRFYKTSIKRPRKLPAPVVSIGNLTVGGTGKTPAVIALARQARSRGFSPVILTRGYRGSRKGVSFVSKGSGPILDPNEAGDEPCLMAERLPGVTIVKGGNRYEAALACLEGDLAPSGGGAATLFILDDGFQHWGLARDIDVVLIDATNPLGNGKLLPEGPLREPLSSIRRADVIVLSKSDLADAATMTATIEKISRYAPDTPVFRATHDPIELVDARGEACPTSSIRGRRVFCFSGIANPVYFHATLRSLGADVVDSMNFRDHHAYTAADIQEIRARAMGLDIVTTEKDMVKLKGLDIPEGIRALRIEFSVDEAFYENIFRRIG